MVINQNSNEFYVKIARTSHYRASKAPEADILKLARACRRLSERVHFNIFRNKHYSLQKTWINRSNRSHSPLFNVMCNQSYTTNQFHAYDHCMYNDVNRMLMCHDKWLQHGMYHSGLYVYKKDSLLKTTE